MLTRSIRILPLVAFVVAALVGCSTIPKVSSPSGVDVNVTPMTTSQVRTYYGTNAQGDPNPFLPPGGLISKQTQDFIVLRIEVLAAKAAEISIDGVSAEDSAGTTVARPYSWEQFKRNLEDWYQAGRSTQIRYERARRAYLPGRVLQLNPGRWDYVLVLVGKHPMPHPVQVKVAIGVNAEQPRAYTFEANPVG